MTITQKAHSSIDDKVKDYKGILENILEAKKAADSDEVVKLNFLQFDLSTEIASHLVGKGRFIESHDWLVYSLSDKIDYEDPTDFQVIRIEDFLKSTEPYIAQNALSTILQWQNTLFYYSRHHGGQIDLAKSIDDIYSFINSGLIAGRLQRGSTPFEIIVQTAVQVLAWRVGTKRENIDEFAKLLEDLFESTSSLEIKKWISSQFAFGGAEFTSKTSFEWAELVLSGFDALLHPLEEMQLVARVYAEKADQIRENRNKIISSIGKYIGTIQHLDVIHRKYEKSRLFNMLAGLILSCLENKHFDIARDIICLFYEIDDDKVLAENQLYLICNYHTGAMYTSPLFTINPPQQQPYFYATVMLQSNRFLSATVALNNYPDFKLEKPARPGVPVINEGPAFEKTLSSHYQFGVLKDTRFGDLDSMIIIPGVQHPVQSLMIKELGKTLPISTSFEKSKAPRKIKKVLLWCFGTRTSDLEYSLVKKMMEKAGIEVEEINILETSKADFISKYSSSSYDLIWVGTHGEFEHYKPHESKIDIHPDGKIELGEIMGLVPDTESQRLLFLNICDGATASTLNAVYDIGFGASLANRNQAVLSHIWPIEIVNSFIYGVLIAHFLINGNSFIDSYTKTVQSFLKGKEHIIGLLSPYIELEEELGYYLEKLDDDVGNNIYYWASGAYYQ